MANFDQFEISEIDIKQTSVLEFQTNAFIASLTIYFWQCTVYSVQCKFNKSPTLSPTPFFNSSQMTEHTWGLYPILNKNSRTLQWFSRAHFPFLKDSIQCKKEPMSLLVQSTTWASLSWRSCSFSFGLDKVSTEIQGFSSNNCNRQGLSRCMQTLHTAESYILHACVHDNESWNTFVYL